jgi:hypothetical protein
MIDGGVWIAGLRLHSVYKLVQDARELILSFDPAQKRIQVSDRSRHRPKFYILVQAPRFICGVNLKSKI